MNNKFMGYCITIFCGFLPMFFDLLAGADWFVAKNWAAIGISISALFIFEKDEVGSEGKNLAGYSFMLLTASLAFIILDCLNSAGHLRNSLARHLDLMPLLAAASVFGGAIFLFKKPKVKKITKKNTKPIKVKGKR